MHRVPRLAHIAEDPCAAIIVACLASFRTLYTKSKQQNRGAPPEVDPPRHLRIIRDRYHGYTTNDSLWNSTDVTAEDGMTYELRSQLSLTSDLNELPPPGGVLIRHDLSVLPDAPEES